MLDSKIKTITFYLTLIISLCCVSNLFGAVKTVTTNDDTNDFVCDSHCSLREAISAANTADTIIFARELRGGIIHLMGTLVIAKRITIDGPNKRRVTLKGDNTFRILETRSVVSIDGLIIRDGGDPGKEGGGIYNTGTLNMTNCIVINNKAKNGGGIYSFFGNVFVIDSTIVGNISTAEESGGGLELYRSTARIMNSTISNNQTRATVGGAGGILIYRSDNWFVTGSTIAFNSSNSTLDSSAGGLLAFNGTPGPISNTILAKNTGFNPDFYGRSSGATNSLIGITDSRSGIVNGVNGNIVGSAKNPVDPQLGILTDNGGSIPTHSLLNISPAIDTGSNDLSMDRHGRPLTIDQRNFNRPINSIVDMGSFEYNSNSTQKFSTILGQVIGKNRRSILGSHLHIYSVNGIDKFTITNPFGYFRFINLPSDEIYNINYKDKHFSNFSSEIFIEEDIEYINVLRN